MNYEKSICINWLVHHFCNYQFSTECWNWYRFSTSSAKVDINSTNSGLLIPRMSTLQRNAIASPAAGLLVFDMDKGTLFFFDGALWTPLAFVNPTNIPLVSRSASDGSMDDFFGYRVAISNNYAIAGAYFDDILTPGDNRGSAYIFQRLNGSWVQQQKITADDELLYDAFGQAVAINDSVAVVASEYADVDGMAERNETTITINNRLGFIFSGFLA